MNFNSFQFFAFFAVVYGLYVLSRDNFRRQNWLLLVASYYFYASWNWKLLGLIFFSTLVDYVAGLKIADADDRRTKKAWVTVSLVSNLSLLGFFKYFNFFVASAVDLSHLIGLPLSPFSLQIVLPVGISFYTFQSLSYSIDIYRGECQAIRFFPDFALYVSYFPQLVAGPIERAKELLPRLTGARTMTYDQLSRGAFLVLLGLVKKIAVADGFARTVDSVFNRPGPASGYEVLIASYAFCIQIYCDFSAYSDIARGVSKMMGIDLMKNFRMPLFATSPGDFWKRWHISLSTWLRDYLYIPLGGNRKGELRTYVNIGLTFFWGGLWHGAAWNFVIWGMYNGVLVSLWKFLKIPVKKWLAIPVLGVVYFVLHFQTIAYGRLLFRANSWAQVRDYTAALVTGWGPSGLSNLQVDGPPNGAVLGLPLILAFDLAWQITGDDKFYRRLPLWVRTLGFALFLFALLFGLKTAPAEFVYFQF